MVMSYLDRQNKPYEVVEIDDKPEIAQKLYDMGYRTVPVTTNGRDYVAGYNLAGLNKL